MESGTGAANDDLSTTLMSMTTIQLKQELKKRKLKTAGLKSELIARLLPFMQLEREHGETEHDDDNPGKDDDEDTRRQEHDGGNNTSDSSDEDEAPIERRFKKETRRNQLLTFRDVEESLETFSGDDRTNVKRWIKDFKEMAVLCEWSDIQKVAYAKRLLRGSAKLFVNYEKCTKTWKKLRRALIEEFANIVNGHAVHQELSRRKKTSDESYQAYIYKMLEIAAQADVDTQSVIQYIIEGIQDDAVNKTVLHGAKTIRELKERFTRYEAIKMEGKSKMRQSKLEEKKKMIRGDAGPMEAKRCFNCDSKDHLGKACPTKDRGVKCFKCNQYGHIAKLCKVAP
ncbi:uncharacterized protein LOC109610141 isoform X2 [Camponotus floridanus]|uniref:uncharacterized protein LOC109610141 isoform X2 n=1 Tax=Camponotus floridanus TaxID=104421 RepID=UPI000DC68523|nr:uncharacterized protein LOC109610141 isoform X2 [Camponotus floridanus]XP_025266571.1 uncharacterized protein LOC109610141 isoform X2 [Camponotus floridanus]